MEILATTDTSRAGNDCYIHSSVTLLKQFGIFLVVELDKTTGWFERSEANIVCQTESPQKAVQAFKEHGGILSEHGKKNVFKR